MTSPLNTHCETAIDDLNIFVRCGGQITIPCATNTAQLALLYQMAMSISSLLEGTTVSVVNWLPGLRLTVTNWCTADELIQMDLQSAWPALQSRLEAWLDMPAGHSVLQLTLGRVEAWVIPSDFLVNTAPKDRGDGFCIYCTWGGLDPALWTPRSAAN